MNDPATAASPQRDADAALVDAAQRGDVQAFEALYRRHVGHVYALCVRMTAEGSVAEELTQRIWIRAWERLDSFRGDSAFTTWLHRVAINLVLGERRADMRRGSSVELTETALEPDLGTSSGAGTDEEIALDRALAKLPEGAKTVFVLHDVYGHSQSDIAALLGTAVGTVKSQLHRARRLLRETLQ